VNSQYTDTKNSDNIADEIMYLDSSLNRM